MLERFRKKLGGAIERSGERIQGEQKTKVPERYEAGVLAEISTDLAVAIRVPELIEVNDFYLQEFSLLFCKPITHFITHPEDYDRFQISTIRTHNISAFLEPIGRDLDLIYPLNWSAATNQGFESVNKNRALFNIARGSFLQVLQGLSDETTRRNSQVDPKRRLDFVDVFRATLITSIRSKSTKPADFPSMVAGFEIPPLKLNYGLQQDKEMFHEFKNQELLRTSDYIPHIPSE